MNVLKCIVNKMKTVLALSVCANNTFLYNPPDQAMAFNDLNHFKWNCENAPDQYAFLKYQLKNTTPFPVDYERRAVIYKSMNEIETSCGGVPEPRASQCVNVREDFVHGTGQATVCHSGNLAPLERPVVNKWEAIVDQ